MIDPQAVAAFQWILITLSGYATTKGWLSSDQAHTLVTSILAIIGPLGMIGSVIWTIWRNSHANVVNRAANIAGVKSITTTAALASSVDHPKVTAKGA